MKSWSSDKNPSSTVPKFPSNHAYSRTRARGILRNVQPLIRPESESLRDERRTGTAWHTAIPLARIECREQFAASPQPRDPYIARARDTSRSGSLISARDRAACLPWEFSRDHDFWHARRAGFKGSALFAPGNFFQREAPAREIGIRGIRCVLFVSGRGI